jgi:hypothetical protein
MNDFARLASLVLVMSGLTSFAFAGEAAPKLPDSAAAIAAAEQAAMPMLGQQLLPQARPFVASQHGDNWLVISKPALPPKQPGGNKQAVIVTLDMITGAVLDVDTAQ